MARKKKKWETPKLICLYRGRPEEAVLLGCKGTPGMGMGGAGHGSKCLDTCVTPTTT